MLLRLPLLVAAGLALIGGAPPAPTVVDDPNVAMVEPTDAAMAAAVERARAELPAFFARLAAPGPDEDSFSVKFGLPGREEFIWAGDLRREGGQWSGALNNVPLNPAYRQGQRVPIADADIIDWTYRRGSAMQGHHTTRVILASMPEDQAAGIRAALGW